MLSARNERENLRQQSGNFLLQALLGLTLVFSFIPIFVGRISSDTINSQMSTTSRQISTLQTVARIYIQENTSSIPYNTTIIKGNAVADTLEPYGLPLGFIPKTALGQDIVLVITKDADSISAYLELTGGNLSKLQMAELARRIGFYADTTDSAILIGIALDDKYSDIVRRNEKNLDAGAFLTDLSLGDFNFTNTGSLIGRRAEFDSAQFTTLSITGTEAGRKEKNDIKNIIASKTVFQTKTGDAAFSLTRGTLNIGNVNARTVSKFGDTGNFVANIASAYDFALTAGRTSFVGPADWYIGGSVVTDKIIFTTERLDVSSFINVSRGQDVYINSDTLDVSSRSGIETDSLIVSAITLRDQTSDALSDGQSGAVVIDIRPNGTSILPDVLLDEINNDAISILANPASDDATQTKCSAIIDDLHATYNQKSLSQYIICQYVFWHRLEKRINAKQCLMDGKSGCL